MSLSARLDRLHARAKGNKWLRYFAVFNRIGLAAGFLPSGFVKIMGERFTALSSNHPMGHYLEALHHTGYYYTFIGIAQVTAAILLLIPRTAVLGAMIYFPIILNICILSHAVRFDGSLISSPLMVLANLFLLCWYYDKIKFILPFKQPLPIAPEPERSTKFPVLFFAGVFAIVALVVLLFINVYSIKPYNTKKECKQQFEGSNRTQAGNNFCDCIFENAMPLDKAMEEYKKAPDDTDGR